MPAARLVSGRSRYAPEAALVLDKHRRGAASRPADPGTVAAFAPHAGWAFSGRSGRHGGRESPPAGRRLRAHRWPIFGGHLPPGARPLAARELSFDTPLGAIDADLELLAALEGR